MIALLYGKDAKVRQWVCDQLEAPSFNESATSIGILRNGELIAGIVYNNYIPGRTIEMSIASTHPKWCARKILNSLFAYPFLQLGVKRVQATSSIHNHHAHNFLERLGFQKEGVLRELYYGGGDAVLYSMLKHECKWLNYEST